MPKHFIEKWHASLKRTQKAGPHSPWKILEKKELEAWHGRGRSAKLATMMDDRAGTALLKPITEIVRKEAAGKNFIHNIVDLAQWQQIVCNKKIRKEK